MSDKAVLDATAQLSREPLDAEVIEQRLSRPECWVVEAIDRDGDGECYLTAFSGPRANERAREYAAAKYVTALVRQ